MRQKNCTRSEILCFRQLCSQKTFTGCGVIRKNRQEFDPARHCTQPTLPFALYIRHTRPRLWLNNLLSDSVSNAKTTSHSLRTVYIYIYTFIHLTWALYTNVTHTNYTHIQQTQMMAVHAGANINPSRPDQPNTSLAEMQWKSFRTQNPHQEPSDKWFGVKSPVRVHVC